ncbi:hypothetical protein [Pseudonocardia lacus]|uniref:hypothetical protein n=1 Tax=Pseudonocardia lacus TaxID=2835865 RepID=UPI001BDD884E|nr:hypothetical protein [Pseudonocardia lacus]
MALAIALVALTAGCAVEASPPKGNCSPGYEAPSKLGSFSAQQRGPGAAIQWGIYPNYPATRYIVDIFVGRQKVDGKNQAYPPHGSVSARTVAGKSGQDFTASGQIFDAKGNVLNFQLKCVIA